MSKGTATISPCGLYRYWLERAWDIGTGKDFLNFIMLNPSTADAEKDDPTIRKCVGFAKRWGYGGVHIVNLFALRATDPGVMLEHADPVGPENDHFIEAGALSAPVTVCGWGRMGSHRDRAAQVLSIVRRLCPRVVALRVNRDGSPAHPLYMPYDIEPVEYRP